MRLKQQLKTNTYLFRYGKRRRFFRRDYKITTSFLKNESLDLKLKNRNYNYSYYNVFLKTNTTDTKLTNLLKLWELYEHKGISRKRKLNITYLYNHFGNQLKSFRFLRLNIFKRVFHFFNSFLVYKNKSQKNLHCIYSLSILFYKELDMQLYKVINIDKSCDFGLFFVTLYNYLIKLFHQFSVIEYKQFNIDKNYLYRLFLYELYQIIVSFVIEQKGIKFCSKDNLKNFATFNLNSEKKIFNFIYRSDSNFNYQQIIASYCPIINGKSFRIGFSNSEYYWRQLRTKRLNFYRKRAKLQNYKFKKNFFWVLGKLDQNKFNDRFLGCDAYSVDTGLATVYSVDQLYLNNSYKSINKSYKPKNIVIGLYSFDSLLGYVNMMLTNRIFYTISNMVIRSNGLYKSTNNFFFDISVLKKEIELSSTLFNYFILNSTYNLYYWNFLSSNFNYSNYSFCKKNYMKIFEQKFLGYYPLTLYSYIFNNYCMRVNCLFLSLFTFQQYNVFLKNRVNNKRVINLNVVRFRKNLMPVKCWEYYISPRLGIVSMQYLKQLKKFK